MVGLVLELPALLLVQESLRSLGCCSASACASVETIKAALVITVVIELIEEETE